MNAGTPWGERRSLEEIQKAAEQCFDWWQNAQEPSLLDEFPAQELFQCISDVASPTDWQRKWLAVGGRISGGKMIALKNDPIWCRLSQFGLPYPPFDEYDLMAVRDVERSAAEKVGLLTPKDTIRPTRRKWAGDKRKIFEVLSPAMAKVERFQKAQRVKAVVALFLAASLAWVTKDQWLGVLKNLGKESPPADPPRAAASGPAVALRPDQREAIELAVKQGFIKLDVDRVRAYVDPEMWLRFDAQGKEDLAATLATRMAELRSKDSVWIEVFDKQSGKQLAKFDTLFGFKIY